MTYRTFAVSASLCLMLSRSMAADTVTMNVRLKVAASCSIAAPSTTVAFGDITKPGSMSGPITMGCNTRYRYTLTSKNGALTLDGKLKSPSPFATAMPYTLGFKSAVQSMIALAACQSSNIAAADLGCSGVLPGVANPQASIVTLGFTWTPSPMPLIAGSYSDVVTLTVRPEY